MIDSGYMATGTSTCPKRQLHRRRQAHRLNGHGTHIAGTIAAKDNAGGVVGAAPGAPLTGVKVLGCDGEGTLTSILKGVDSVTAKANKPAIANMSLSGPASQTLDDAVKKSASSGAPVPHGRLSLPAM